MRDLGGVTAWISRLWRPEVASEVPSTDYSPVLLVMPGVTVAFLGSPAAGGFAVFSARGGGIASGVFKFLSRHPKTSAELLQVSVQIRDSGDSAYFQAATIASLAQAPPATVTAIEARFTEHTGDARPERVGEHGK